MHYVKNVLLWFFGAFTISVFVTIFTRVLSLIIQVDFYFGLYQLSTQIFGFGPGIL